MSTQTNTEKELADFYFWSGWLWGAMERPDLHPRIVQELRNDPRLRGNVASLRDALIEIMAEVAR